MKAIFIISIASLKFSTDDLFCFVLFLGDEVSVCSLELPVEQAGLTLGAFLLPPSPQDWDCSCETLGSLSPKESPLRPGAAGALGVASLFCVKPWLCSPAPQKPTCGDACPSSPHQVLREENKFKVILSHLAILKSVHATGDPVSTNKKENNSSKENNFLKYIVVLATVVLL